MKQENITIQYALSPEGEHFIPGVGKVYEFCRQTNTIYEYHGDFLRWQSQKIFTK